MFKHIIKITFKLKYKQIKKNILFKIKILNIVTNCLISWQAPIVIAYYSSKLLSKYHSKTNILPYPSFIPRNVIFK